MQNTITQTSINTVQPTGIRSDFTGKVDNFTFTPETETQDVNIINNIQNQYDLQNYTPYEPVKELFQINIKDGMANRMLGDIAEYLFNRKQEQILLAEILFIHLFVTSIELTKDGAFIKTIDENAKEWFYRSAELFILSFKIDILVIILFIMLSLVFYKKTILSFTLQLLPILLITLCNLVYKEFICSF